MTGTYTTSSGLRGQRSSPTNLSQASGTEGDVGRSVPHDPGKIIKRIGALTQDGRTAPELQVAGSDTFAETLEFEPPPDAESSVVNEQHSGLWSRTVQVYRGTVISVDSESQTFVAEIVDETPENSGAQRSRERSRGTFNFGDVSEDQHSRIVEDAEFFWSFWYHVVKGTRRGTTCDFWFRRVPPLSEEEFERAVEEGDRDAKWFAEAFGRQDRAAR